MKYKDYKNLFEKIKVKSKIQHFSSLLKKHQNNSEETWKVMKHVISKSKTFNDRFPKRIVIDKQEIYKQDKIADKIADFFKLSSQNSLQRKTFYQLYQQI